MRNMKKLAGIILSLAVIMLLPSCSSTKEATKEDTPKKDSVYVFDQAPPETVKKVHPQVETPPVETQTPVENQSHKGTHYFVQIGAFSTREAAETFSSAAKQKLNRDATIRFNQEARLYVVQLDPPFMTRTEAEKVRDDIKLVKEYNDAWIVTVPFVQ
jgi:cell division protein FtsN